MIFRCFRSRDPHVLTKAFISFCRPLIEFGSPVFNSITAAKASMLEGVQRRATKRIFQRASWPLVDYKSRLKALSLSSLAERRMCADLLIAHSIFHGKHFSTSIVKAPTNPRYPLSHAHRLLFDTRPKGLHKRSPRDRICRLWNRLPPSVTLLKRDAFRAKIVNIISEWNLT